MDSVIFGAGTWGKGLKKGLEKYYGIHICAICDNDKSKWGSIIDNVKITPPPRVIKHGF